MSDPLKIETTYIPHLHTHFSSGSLVLFTGAGFSLEALNSAGGKLPSAGRLTEILWDLCFPGEEFETDTQLQDIFLTAQSQHAKKLGGLLNELFTVDVESIPDWYKKTLSMPWLRAYTLNIDDLLEKAHELGTSPRNVNSISATTGSTTNITDTHLDVIHLNGMLSDAPDNVVFSREQYARRIGNDPFYQQLYSDLLARPIVFIGSSLEEGAMWEHIIARGPKGSRVAAELRPRSYLVLPHLNKSKHLMLAKYNVVWLPMTGQQFCENILDQLESAKAPGFESLSKRGLFSAPGRYGISLVSEVSQDIERRTEYLLGQEPTWSDVQNDRVAIRSCFEDIWTEIESARANTKNSDVLLVTGTAGVGKSSVLIWAAIKLHAEGVVVGWVDSENKLSFREFIDSVNSIEELGALFINDADVYGSGLSTILYALLTQHPRLIVVIEARSSKVDIIINTNELRNIHVIEKTVPNLCDSDIDKIITVLDRENRLGELKGKNHAQRRQAFQQQAGRQLLVAMYEATSGRKFAERAENELADLSGQQKFVYGLISTASAYRFSLTRDEILIACGEATNEALNAIDLLVRRKLIHISSDTFNSYKARHRVIAEIGYNYLVAHGKFEPLLRGLFMIGVAKVSPASNRNSRPSRILRTFSNHNFMKRVITEDAARVIYGEFEDALSWDSHYWLHRGALELEANNLDLAENFLNQAMSLRHDDPLIQTEWAYLLFKKAIANPQDVSSTDMIDEATKTLESIIVRRSTQSGHAYHVLGFQGMKWADAGIHSDVDRANYLSGIKNKIGEAVKMHPGDRKLRDLYRDVEEAILRIAVK